ncbi:MAG: hypothetical protein ABII00_17550 [Elusimicrobiota bacterium]
MSGTRALKASAPPAAAWLVWLIIPALSGCTPLPKQEGRVIPLLQTIEGRLPGSRVEYLAPGVVYARWQAESREYAHVIAIDLRRKDLYVKPLLGHDRIDGGPAAREALDGMARRSGALVALGAGHPSNRMNVRGLTIIDGNVHLAPDPPEVPAVIIGRDNRVWIGRMHPGSDPEPDYFQAIGGLRSLAGGGSADQPAAQGGETADAAAESPPGWTALCLSSARTTMNWIYVENPRSVLAGKPRQTPERLTERLECGQTIIMGEGYLAGMALRDKMAGSVLSDTWSQMSLDDEEREPPEARFGSALGLFRLGARRPRTRHGGR